MTAVDSNVLIDILGADPQFGRASLAAARRCRDEGILIACDAVWAEVVAAFADTAQTESSLARIPVDYSPIVKATATRAGMAWRAYRLRGGPRERLVTDFIVGAHANEQADRLLTRDRGFQRSAFEGLTIVDPTA
ncbi:MAG: hypothetical protein A2Z32_10550 [Chloroflexi bacterium RBG_16_69_14]|nr:MAG: hypothetical protein A2Z32_10550 [Chloroflexi bacterium RBG_16_69_14]